MEQNLVNIFKHMSEYLDDAQIGTILKDMSEYLDVAELAAVIEDAIPDDCDVPLSTKIFGTPEQIEILLHNICLKPSVDFRSRRSTKGRWNWW
jgi:hypothetical protein